MSDAKGIVMRAAHFPGRAPIDAYGDGGFRFAGMSHRGSLMVIPSGIYGWEPADRDAISAADLEAAAAEVGDFEFLLIGTGEDIRGLAPGARVALRERGVRVELMVTGAAVRTFNVLMAEDRAVAAAFVAIG